MLAGDHSIKWKWKGMRNWRIIFIAIDDDDGDDSCLWASWIEEANNCDNKPIQYLWDGKILTQWMNFIKF